MSQFEAAPPFAAALRFPDVEVGVLVAEMRGERGEVPVLAAWPRFLQRVLAAPGRREGGKEALPF